MARYKYQGYVRDGNGTVMEDATIAVYLTTTTTAASIYTAISGGTAVNSVTSGSDGHYYFWVDDGDYATTQKFDITLSKADYESKSLTDIRIFY